MTDSATPWHCLAVKDIADQLKTFPDTGLESADAAQRLQDTGPNSLTQKPQRPAWKLLVDQFRDLMILILIGAALIAGFSGDLVDTLAIATILLLNAGIGFTQELRAQKAMAALHAMATPNANIRRDGRLMDIPAVDLVPGDIVLLDAGDLVPADLRLISASDLLVDESMLTGESIAVIKDAELLTTHTLALGDRLNMAFKGTLIARGRAEGIVVATGMDTELGHIAGLLQNTTETKTPLQLRLSAFSKKLALGVLLICVVIFITGLLRGESALLMLLTAVSVAVAAIPESLPAVVTISLSIGAFRLARSQALVRTLQSVETLGSVTWICTDKTGTLTLNSMQVEALELCNEAALTRELALQAMALCNDAERHDDKYTGDPTETALLQYALEAGVVHPELLASMPRNAELAFDSQRMRMTTFHQNDTAVLAFTKGAPEVVLPLCTRLVNANADQPFELDAEMAKVTALAADGMRVLVLACKTWPSGYVPADGEDSEPGLQYIGLIGLLDPPRAEAGEAIATCLIAGITPLMITGDHPATAMAISKRLGLVADPHQVVTGQELSALDDATLKARLQSLRVVARADPAQKIRIVRLLQEQGEFVAMTGDGVNDAPALKQANIGVAMGLSGTDVAREAADLILLDDNFATIVEAIRGGRRIYANIRRFIRYVLTTNLAEVLVIFLAPLLGMPLPLLPVHILWINLVSDGLPGLALTAEPAARDLMKAAPRPPGESLFAGGLWQHMLVVGAFMTAQVLALQAWGMQTSPETWQTLVFTAMTFTQLGHVMAIRSERTSLWQLGLMTNLPLLSAVLLTVVLQLCVVYLPVLNSVFSTSPLSALELLLCFATTGLTFTLVETEKWARRKGWLYKAAAVK